MVVTSPIFTRSWCGPGSIFSGRPTTAYHTSRSAVTSTGWSPSQLCGATVSAATLPSGITATPPGTFESCGRLACACSGKASANRPSRNRMRRVRAMRSGMVAGCEKAKLKSRHRDYIAYGFILGQIGMIYLIPGNSIPGIDVRHGYRPRLSRAANTRVHAMMKAAVRNDTLRSAASSATAWNAADMMLSSRA